MAIISYFTLDVTNSQPRPTTLDTNLLKDLYCVTLYILLDVLVCSTAIHFYESCSIFTSTVGRVKIQMS